MKVYVVMQEWPYDATNIQGVFENEIRADMLVHNLDMQYSGCDHWMEEWEVNADS
jgi:hypothetical protein